MKFASALLSCWFLASAALSASANESPALSSKPDLVKGAATAAVCSACHSIDGSRGSPAQPILQGQHPEYLVKQLHEFKSGARENAIMRGFASTLSDEDMKNVAAFYASKQAKPGFAKNAGTVALGEKIYRGGVAERQIAACAGCHSPNGAGLPVAVSAVGRPACRLHRGAADRLSQRCPQEQRGDDGGRRQAE